MRKNCLKLCALVLALAVFWGQTALAIMPGPDDYPWNNEASHPLDKPVKDKYPKGSFFLNLGPTGLRARINEDTPTQLLIKFVFQDDKSPARGLVNSGDVLVGANGKLFEKPHLFGRQGNAKGWDGPLMDLSRHIEDSQGSDGKLNLTVWPNGDKKKQKTVTIQLKQVGRFSKTYPFDCPRSERMLEELCEFIVSEHERKGGNWGRIHVKSHCILALMASGNPKYEPLIKNIVSEYAKKRYSPFDGGFTTWNWGFDGIVMGEYYHRYKDKNLIPAIESLKACYEYGHVFGGAQGQGGIYTHRSYPVIVKDGAKPYASIAGISALGMVAMSLFKTEGLPYSESIYNEIHQAFLRSSSPDGVKIAYAFKEGPKIPEEYASRHAHVVLNNPKESESGKGPGFICPEGMKKITKYKLIWPTKDDPRYKPTDWIEKERDTNIVIELKDGDRLIYRNHPKGQLAVIPEPTGPFTTTSGSRHILPTGLGAAAHLIDSKEKSWYWFGKHCANTCAKNYDDSFSGHGGGQLHGFWQTVGVANADKDKQREYLEYMKSFLILSETHNGGMIVQPWNRDRVGGNGDPYYGPRLLPTATAVMMLSIPKKRLQIMGKSTSAFGLDPASLSSSVKGIHAAFSKDQFASAWKSIQRSEGDAKLTDADKEAVALMKGEIEAQTESMIKHLEMLDRVGDVTRLRYEIAMTSRKFSGVGRFNEVVEPIRKSLSSDANKAKELKIGAIYDKLMTFSEKSESSDVFVALEEFAKRYPDSVYGKACAYLFEVYGKNKDLKLDRNEYFIKIDAEMTSQ